MTLRRTRRTGEDGYAAGELALGVGLLVLPTALLVLTLPGWVERQSAARTIARQVAREAASAGVCDSNQARATAARMADGLDVRVGLVAVLDCADGQPLPRGASVTAAVTVTMPAVHIPGIGPVATWRWSARHTQPVDRYASLR